MKNTNTKTLTRVALLVAIELVMKLVGLGSVPVGPLYMSFLTLPIAVGAITMGPAVGALLGGVFGAVSFYDAITGASAMTGALFQVSPLNTFILCVGMRVLMGLCAGIGGGGLRPLAPTIMNKSAMAATMGMAVLQFAQCIGNCFSPVYGGMIDAGYTYWDACLFTIIPLSVVMLIAAIFINPKPKGKPLSEEPENHR